MNRFGEIIGDDRFASGYTTYTDHYGGEVQNTRIVLPLYVGTLLVSAVVGYSRSLVYLKPCHCGTNESKLHGTSWRG